MFSIQKNGTQFLTATVAASGTTATFSSSQTDFAAGDVLKVVAPATADATLADIGSAAYAQLNYVTGAACTATDLVQRR